MIGLHDRRRLGLLSRVASRTLRDYAQAAVGEREGVPGVIVCVQTFGSVAHLHPHLMLARASGEPPDAVEHEENWPALQARRRWWAELLRRVFKVDVEGCARCGGEARIIGFVTEPQGIRRILAHLERRGVDARAGPWVGVAAAPG